VKLLLRYRDFCDFQDYGRRRLGFSKIRNFNSQPLVRGQYALSYQISSKSTERLRIYGDLTVFQNGGRLPSCICWARIRITHEEHLVVFSAVQNLVEIDAVVLIICRFHCFVRSLFTPPKNGGFRGMWSLWVKKINNGTSKRHIARKHVIWLSVVEIGRGTEASAIPRIK